MANKGKRMTCPECQDSLFVSLEEAGFVYCQNHVYPVKMVDLMEMIRLFIQKAGAPEKEKAR
jgi:hypothetical protein